jgi:hypothetical protein
MVADRFSEGPRTGIAGSFISAKEVTQAERNYASEETFSKKNRGYAVVDCPRWSTEAALFTVLPFAQPHEEPKQLLRQITRNFVARPQLLSDCQAYRAPRGYLGI